MDKTIYGFNEALDTNRFFSNYIVYKYTQTNNNYLELKYLFPILK